MVAVAEYAEAVQETVLPCDANAFGNGRRCPHVVRVERHTSPALNIMKTRSGRLRRKRRDHGYRRTEQRSGSPFSASKDTTRCANLYARKRCLYKKSRSKTPTMAALITTQQLKLQRC